MSKWQLIVKGIVKENPTFVLILGMCPTIGVTSSAINGMGMGVATMAVLIMSNIVISLIKNFIPDKVRIPAFIVVIASFVTIIEMLMQAYVPALYAALGVFIPLIVVNCIILGRAEAFASKNSALASALDGVGIGLGFTVSLTVIGAVREILGGGSIFGVEFAADVMPLVFILAPGGFIVLGYLMVLFNKIAQRHRHIFEHYRQHNRHSLFGQYLHHTDSARLRMRHSLVDRQQGRERDHRHGGRRQHHNVRAERELRHGESHVAAAHALSVDTHAVILYLKRRHDTPLGGVSCRCRIDILQCRPAEQAAAGQRRGLRASPAARRSAVRQRILCIGFIKKKYALPAELWNSTRVSTLRVCLPPSSAPQRRTTVSDR